MANYTPEQLAEQLAQAHMAGQADAGVDPSYSNAQAYVREITKPPDTFEEGQVVAFTGRDGDTDYLEYHTVTNYNWSGYEALNQTEVGPDWVRLESVTPLIEALGNLQGAVKALDRNFKNNNFRKCGENMKYLEKVIAEALTHWHQQRGEG